MKELAPEAKFFTLVNTRRTANNVLESRRARMAWLEPMSQLPSSAPEGTPPLDAPTWTVNVEHAREIVRRAKSVATLEAEVADADAALAEERAEYHTLLAEQRAKLRTVRKGLRRKFITQADADQAEAYAASFADLQNQAPALAMEQPEQEEAAAAAPPAPPEPGPDLPDHEPEEPITRIWGPKETKEINPYLPMLLRTNTGAMLTVAYEERVQIFTGEKDRIVANYILDHPDEALTAKKMREELGEVPSFRITRVKRMLEEPLGFEPGELIRTQQLSKKSFFILQANVTDPLPEPDQGRAMPITPLATSEPTGGSGQPPTPDREKRDVRQVPFTFPGESEAVEVDERVEQLLKTFYPFMDQTEPVHALSREQLFKDRSPLDARGLRPTIGKARIVLASHGFRLGTIVQPTFLEWQHFVEPLPEPQGEATMIGEHIVTATVRYAMEPAEYNLLDQLRTGVSVDMVSAEDVSALAGLLEAATGVANCIVERETQDGTRFYDLTAIDVKRFAQYMPTTPNQLRAMQTYLTESKAALAKESILQSLGELPKSQTPTELQQAFINLLNRGNAGIATAYAEAGDPSELAVYNQYIGSQITPETVLRKMAKSLGVKASNEMIRKFLSRIDNNPQDKRRIIVEAPLPEGYRATDDGITVVVGGDENLVPPAFEEKHRRYIELLRTKADEIMGTVLDNQRFNLDDMWPLGYIETRMPGSAVSAQVLYDLIQNGNVRATENRGSEKRPKYYLDIVGITEALLHIGNPHIPENMYEKVYDLVVTVQTSQRERLQEFHGQRGKRAR